MRRLSISSVQRDCHCCSSRRTISSSTRALLGQWMRRRSSPRRYSRIVTSGLPPPSRSRVRLSPGARPPPGQRDLRERLGARCHQDRGGRGHRLVEVDHPHRVGHPHVHRSRAGSARGTRSGPGSAAWSAPAAPSGSTTNRWCCTEGGRQLLLHQQHARATTGVPDLDLDLGDLAGLDLEVADVAAHPHLALGAAEHQPGQQRHQGGEQPDAHEVPLADLDPADDRRGAGGEEATPPHGQVPHAITPSARQGPVGPGGGTGTWPSTCATTSVVRRPLIVASIVGSSRWGRTSRCQVAYVVGQHVLAALHRRPRLRRPDQVQRRPRGGAEPEIGGAPGRRGQCHGVPLDHLGDVHAVGDLDQLAHLGGVGDRLELLERADPVARGEHRDLGGLHRVAHREPHHEPVALGLGQGVGALHLDRVLGGDHHEGRRRGSRSSRRR